MFDNILMLAQAAAPAAEKGAGGGEGSPLLMLVYLVPIIAVFYLMMRNQKKQQKKHDEMLQALKAGDKIITAGGIHGEIVKVKENTFMVKVADNLTMEFSKPGISRVLNQETNEKEEKK